ncbi:GNAT family N-acetyltransferase [Streptococcus sp.]
MPSLTISLLDAYRGQGIGSQLLDATPCCSERKK